MSFNKHLPRGYFGIGISCGKNPKNIGMLWRSAEAFGANFIFTVKKQYKQQNSDTTNAWKKIPLFHFQNMEDLINRLPFSCSLIGVELDEKATPLPEFAHPERSVYLLGAEDVGLQEELTFCNSVIHIPVKASLNVSVAGSIVMFDRNCKKDVKK